jgi:hypothetical protein
MEDALKLLWNLKWIMKITNTWRNIKEKDDDFFDRTGLKHKKQENFMPEILPENKKMKDVIKFNEFLFYRDYSI